MEIRFKPIGVIHTNASADDVKAGGQEGELEVFPEFADALDGIDGYSHLFVLTYFAGANWAAESKAACIAAARFQARRTS